MSRSARLAVTLSVLVLFVTLASAFAALTSKLWSAPAPQSAPVTSPADAASGTPAGLPDPSAPIADPAAGSAASATGSLAPDPSASTAAPSSTASPTTSSVPEQDGPPSQWPDALPDVGEHRELAYYPGPAQRWVLGVPDGANLTAGRLVADLEEMGWEMTLVVTDAGITAVGERGEERVSLVFRSLGAQLPENWSGLEVIYQQSLPDFELPPTTTPQEAVRRGA